jgi:hypothetical protein
VLVQGFGGTGTAVALRSSRQTARRGRTIVYTATIRPVPRGGAVRFNDGRSPIPGCTGIRAVHGRARCSVSYSEAGRHAIVAAYLGAEPYKPSTSRPLAERVLR